MSHFPILTVTNTWEGGQHKDHKELKQLFYQHKDKVRVCLSGHQHLLDRAWYNGVHYFCNGAMSGFWWEKVMKSRRSLIITRKQRQVMPSLNCTKTERWKMNISFTNITKTFSDVH